MSERSNVVNFRPRARETSYDGSGGDGTGVVTIRIKLEIGDDVSAPAPSQAVKRSACAGGFWLGAIIGLTLALMW